MEASWVISFVRCYGHMRTSAFVTPLDHIVCTRLQKRLQTNASVSPLNHLVRTRLWMWLRMSLSGPFLYSLLHQPVCTSHRPHTNTPVWNNFLDPCVCSHFPHKLVRISIYIKKSLVPKLVLFDEGIGLVCI